MQFNNPSLNKNENKNPIQSGAAAARPFHASTRNRGTSRRAGGSPSTSPFSPPQDLHRESQSAHSTTRRTRRRSQHQHSGESEKNYENDQSSYSYCYCRVVLGHDVFRTKPVDAAECAPRGAKFVGRGVGDTDSRFRFRRKRRHWSKRLTPARPGTRSIWDHASNPFYNVYCP